MKIRVEKSECEGHALCASVAPDIFVLADDGTVRVPDGDPGQERYTDVAHAVQLCPKAALSVS